MEITWYGHSCFRMMERGVASIVTDPFDESIGYPVPTLKADIVTVSHDAPGYNAVANVKKPEYVLSRPGEYEIGGVFITGIRTYNPELSPEDTRLNIIYVFTFDGIVIAHLGNIDYVPTQLQIEQLGRIDILMIPVGGGGALHSSEAAEVISLIEPSTVIPMHYKTPACKLPLDPVDKFLKEMGVSEYEEVDVLKIRSSSLSDNTQIAVLKYAK